MIRLEKDIALERLKGDRFRYITECIELEYNYPPVVRS